MKEPTKEQLERAKMLTLTALPSMPDNDHEKPLEVLDFFIHCVFATIQKQTDATFSKQEREEMANFVLEHYSFDGFPFAKETFRAAQIAARLLDY